VRRWVDYREAYPGDGHTVVGTVKVLREVASPELGNARDLLVYLPPSYGWTYRHYPVVYLQDGQNLFDEATSFAGEWRVDETLESLHDEGMEAIAVGIPNMGAERLNEYSPFVDARLGGGAADAYLRFLVRVVRPLVESEFRVSRGASGTIIGGSSMGGLLSLYGFFEYPEVFGGVLAMSPSLGFAGDALHVYLDGVSRRPGKIYVDAGNLEGAPSRMAPGGKRKLPRGYVLKARRTTAMLVAKGWVRGKDLLYVEDRRGAHDEASWARRLPGALRFLLAR